MSYDVKDALALRHRGFKPWAMAYYDGGIVELVSYPFPSDDGARIMVNVRRDPDDPMTMETVDTARVFT